MIQSLTSVATQAAVDRLGQSQATSVGQVANFGQAGAIGQVDTENSASFSDILANAANGINANLYKAENLSVEKMQGGDIDVREVVNSVMEAERSLNTAIGIRDKIVQAYLEVSRMQI